MKKIMSLLLAVMLVCLFSVRAFADTKSADVLRGAGDYVGAEAAYREALKTLSEADAVSAHYFIATCLQNQGKYAEAIEKFKQGVDAYYSQYGIGDCLLSLGRRDEAIVQYQKVKEKEVPLTGCNYYIGAQGQLARCLKEQEKYDEAIARYEFIQTIERATPSDIVGAKINIAQCLKAQKKPKEAQAMLQEALLLDGAIIGQLKVIFAELNAKILGKDAMTACLNNILMSIPAKAENAEFLGQVKSEIEKLK